MSISVNKRPVSLLGLFQVIAFFTAVFSLLSVFESWHRLIELMAHFKLQYFIAAFLCTLIYVLIKRFKFALAMSLVTVLNGAYILPWYFSSEHIQTADVGTLKIIHSNVNTANREYHKVIALIKHHKPDVFVVQEASQQWLIQLKAIELLLPYKIVEPRSDNFGIALYSKVPLDKAQIRYLGKAKVPSIEVTLTHQQQALTILATHPLPPISNDYYARRNDQLEAIAGAVKASQTPLILIGDLNITMWSNNYQKLIDSTGLKNARKGYGLLPSWPTMLPFAFIPIDHCLVSPQVIVLDIALGPDVGSDHLPLIVEVGLRP